MTNEWKAIPGFEGSYEVSSNGLVRSIDRTVIGRDGGRLQRWRGRPIRASVRKADGYSAVNLSKGGVIEQKLVHVLILEAFVGPRPTGFDACHNDGNARNNVLANLRWGTRTENVRDRTTHGTDNRGSRCGASKLKETDVFVIRARLANGESHGAIAADYPVGRIAILQIANGSAWSHV